MKLRALLLLLIIAIISNLLTAQELTKEDYDKGAEFLWKNVNNIKLFNARVRPHWTADSSRLWFVTNKPGVKRYNGITLKDGEVKDLFDHELLAELLIESTEETIDAKQLSLSNLRWEKADRISFRMDTTDYMFHLNRGTLERAAKSETPTQTPGTAPDKSHFAHIKDYNLYLTAVADSSERQLTTDGHEKLAYATYYGWDDILEGENAKVPDHFYVNWSADSKWLMANQVDFRTADKMYLLDWSVDSLYRPRLLSYYRGSPGDTGMVYVDPVFFNAQSGEMVRSPLPRGTHINQTGFRWSKESNKVYLEWTRRGYQEVSLNRFDLATQELETLYTETSKTNIDGFSYWLAEKADRIFILSERSGWRQLYALNLESEELTPVTGGDYFIHDIERIDEEHQVIYFTAAGKEAGRNPYHQYLYRINFDGSGLKLLTPEDAHHIVSLAPDGLHFTDNYSTANKPTITALRALQDGRVIKVLSTAKVVGVPDWKGPQEFTAVADDGQTIIYGQAWKPLDFDPKKKYPVIDATYTGPHTQRFQKSFDATFAYQSFAEMGFIVVLIDGRGSYGRSKAFHNFSYKNLGGGLHDHIAAIRQFGKENAWVDTTRVGIYGHSAGGYDAGRALLAYPEFYKVGVASSADHDHRMEKAWWPEMYMGWPVDEAYEQQSNVTMAPNLQGKLLLVHGGIDENVNPSATFKLAEALVKADKPFDMLILPSQRHGYRGASAKYFAKRRLNYFLEHLRGVETIWDFEWQ